MATRTKTRRRVQVLLGALLLICLAVPSTYLLRKRQVAARIARDRDLGYRLLDAGEYFAAMHKIGPYLNRHPTDVDALAKYALARCNVEEPNGKHLFEGMGLYRRLLELQPDNAEAHQRLVDLYLTANFNSEVLARTDKKTDAASMRARIIALSRMSRTKEALDLAQKYNLAKPDDLEMQLFTCVQSQRAGTPSEQIFARAEDLLKKHPGDARFQLLMGFACAITGDATGALSWTRQSVDGSLQDPQLVDLAVDQLDRLGRHDEALAVLQKAASTRNDLNFRRLAIARILQSGDVKEAARQLADVDKDLQKADSELLAYRALTFMQSSQHEAAKPILKILESRSSDVTAGAWHGVLSSLPKDEDHADDKRIITACRDALKSRSKNPYFHYWLGEAYARVGEMELALQQWSMAGELAPMWGVPQARVLRAALWTESPDNVRSSTDQLASLSSSDVEVLSTVAIAKARSLRSADAPQVADIFTLIDRVQKAQPFEPLTLILKLKLLTQQNRTGEVKGLLDAVLSSESNPPEETLLALARVSETLKLNVEDLCIARCKAKYGNTCGVARAEAARLLRQSSPSEAVKAFETTRDASADKTQTSWRIAWAGLLDDANDSRAASELASLADSQTENLAIQQMVIGSRVARKDRALARRAIDRVGAVIGEEGTTWRIADARWLIQEGASKSVPHDREDQFVKAASVLNDVSRKHPELVASRLLLSDCLASLNRRDAAAEQLVIAAKLVPDAFEVNVSTASMLQAMGDYERARPYVEQSERLLKNAEQPATQPAGTAINDAAPTAATGHKPDSKPPRNNADAWRSVAKLLSAQGETDRAISILQRVDGQTEQQGADVTLASLLAERGDLDDATCKRLLENATPRMIGVIADGYARAGRGEQADATIAKLDRATAGPGEREYVRGVYLHRRGKISEAIKSFTEATNAAPANREAWQALVAAQLDSGRLDDALQFVERAARAIPDSPIFSRITSEASLLRAVAGLPAARPVMTALASNPEYIEQEIAALRVLRDSQSAKRSSGQTAAELRPIADRAPGCIVLQNVLASLYVNSNNIDAASAIAQRAMKAAPADPAPARRAAEMLANAKRWPEVFAVAEEWRRRSGKNLLPADMMLANASLAVQDFNAAVRYLEPYREALSKEPTKFVQAVSIYASALARAGKTTDAAAFLKPMLPLDSAMREIWIVVGANSIQDVNAAAQWLRQSVQAIDPNGPDERLKVAAAWIQLARRDDGTALRDEAVSAVAQAFAVLQANHTTTATQWTALASMKESLGDGSGAEADYRRALAVQSDDAIAQNNLAMILMRRNGDMKEAAQLAGKAANQKDHPNQADFLESLAQIDVKLGQAASAESALRQAVQLRAHDPSFRLRLVEILLHQGKRNDARSALEDLERLSAEMGRPDPRLSVQIVNLKNQLAEAGH